jgi:hypothetical protein
VNVPVKTVRLSFHEPDHPMSLSLQLRPFSVDRQNSSGKQPVAVRRFTHKDSLRRFLIASWDRDGALSPTAMSPRKAAVGISRSLRNAK